MNNIAFIFPGQGSQYVGMGKELIKSSAKASELYDIADKKTSEEISKISFEGPEEILKKTSITQPAILTLSYSLFAILNDLAPDVKPRFYAGHSLGEYSALVAAGVINFSDAVYLVNKRGKYMEQALPNGTGKMAAILGIDSDIAQSICAEVSTNNCIVEVANMNCPGQIVISGHNAAISLAADLAIKKGARKVIPLSVSGPFHSSLMQDAALNLKAELNNITLNDTATPVIANVTAQPVNSAKDFKKLLIEQVTSSVLWQQSIEYMISNGVEKFVEIGPGQVLSGLVKKIDRNIKSYVINDQESMNKFLQEVL